MKWSKYQKQIFTKWAASEDNIIVNAVAGSGKTTTILEMASLSENPIMLAFNKSIAQEINKKYGRKIASTIHSLCFNMIKRSTKKRINVDGAKYYRIARAIYRKHARFIANAFNLMRLGLYKPEQANIFDPIAYAMVENLIGKLYMLIEIGNSETKSGIIDFTDMLFIAYEDELAKPYWYKELFIDECQDLSPLTIEVVRKYFIQNKIAAVGDPRQAIYAFAGADCNSFQRVKQELYMEEMPLSICYRCKSEIVDFVNSLGIVDTIEPYESGGEVTYADSKQEIIDLCKEYHEAGKHKDIKLVGRKKHTVTQWCIDLIKQDIPAYIVGSGIGKTLSAQLDNMIKIYQRATKHKPEPSEFIDVMAKYRVFVKEKMPPDVAEDLIDSASCIQAIWENTPATSWNDIKHSIENLFNDDKNEKVIKISTIHKAKGLEAKTVVVLDWFCMPLSWKGITEEQYQQEQNLMYVAATRAKDKLILTTENIAL